jgi:uncharacterized protein (DUF885 family)
MRPLLVLALATLLSACQPGAPKPPAGVEAAPAAVAQAGQEYIDLTVAISPENATQLGLHQRDEELDDRTLAGFARDTRREEDLLKELARRFPTPPSDRQARTDLEILRGQLAVDVRWRREVKPLETMPEVYTSPMSAIFVMTAREYAPPAERAKKVLARLEKIPAVVAAARQNLKNPPKIWTQVGIEAAEGAEPFFDAQRAFLLGALPGEAARIEALLASAKGAYRDFKTFLEREVMPRSSGSFAAGRPLFDFLLHESYFVKENADEVLAIGKRAFALTDKQMTEVARRIDPQASGWPEVTKKIKQKHPTAADLLPSYVRQVARARAFLVQKDVVSFPPGDDCQVLETPAFRRSTMTASYDQPPPFDQGTRGFFFVTPVDPSLSPEKQEATLREHDFADQAGTSVHEVYPGHHLQLSFARLHPSLIRRVTGPSIFAEGWGLYSEELMAELGYYNDEERLAQLEWTLVRAARVIIDVGLHTGGMTYEQAVHVLTDQVHLELPLAESEVKRYTSSPTQPLSYLIGREAIFHLRERYKAREGARYTLRRFHDEVLGHGTIAPGLLEREIFDP